MCAGLSISETIDHLGFLCSALEFTKYGGKKQKASSEWQFCRSKHLVDEKDQRRMTGLSFSLTGRLQKLT